MARIITVDDFSPIKTLEHNGNSGMDVTGILDTVNAVLNNPLVQPLIQSITQKIQISNAERIGKLKGNNKDNVETIDAVVLFED